jgi:hypothetical protein
MLNQEQRDHIIKLHDEEQDPQFRELLQAFSSMHNRRDRDPVLTDISVDLMSIACELRRGGHSEEASYVMAQLAGAIIRPDMMRLFAHAIRQASGVAAVSKQIEQALGLAPKKKKKKEKKGGDSGEQSTVS